MSNPSPPPEKENPGALAGATGAEYETSEFQSQGYRKPRRGAMSLYAKREHKRACRMLGYALTLGEPDTWHGTSQVWGTTLTTAEVASIAYAALRALEPADREMTFNAAHWGSV